MCAPLLMGLSLIGSLAGGAIQAAGARQQADAQSQAYQVQAAQARAQSDNLARQGVLEQQTSQYQQRRKGEQADALEARQRAAFGSSGLTIDGSPTDVLTDSVSENAMDVAAIQYNSRLKAQNLNYEAGLSSFNAVSNDTAAKTAKKSGDLAVAGALIGGVTKAAGSFFGPSDPSTKLGLKF